MSKKQQPRPESGPVLGPPDILGRARSEASRLEKLARWEVAFAGASQVAPLLVRRLDRPDTFYYLVQYRAPKGMSARLRIDAHTGQLAEAIAIDKSGDALVRYLTADDILRRLAPKAGGSAGKKATRPSVVIEPLLAWRPCRQSFSAFLPFHLVWIRQRLHYYRVDGEVFKELTLGAGL